MPAPAFARAEVTHEPIAMPDGRIGHVGLAIDGAELMMADAHPEIHCPAPKVNSAGSSTRRSTSMLSGVTARTAATSALHSRGFMPPSGCAG